MDFFHSFHSHRNYLKRHYMYSMNEKDYQTFGQRSSKENLEQPTSYSIAVLESGVCHQHKPKGMVYLDLPPKMLEIQVRRKLLPAL